jgi:hypothetical protein
MFEIQVNISQPEQMLEPLALLRRHPKEVKISAALLLAKQIEIWMQEVLQMQEPEQRLLVLAKMDAATEMGNRLDILIKEVSGATF